MDERRSAAMSTGFVVGVLVALGFAIVISLLPESLFLQTPRRVAVYVAVALAAPPTVWFLQSVARLRSLDQRTVFLWGAAGAMTFDGLAIGFVPELYGQTGQALAWTASALIFAFASLIVAGQVMLGRTVPAAG
ncbi:MAG: hypothetical protein O2892_17365 [Actinomycetota bacterium]|nr:hypothetical protein [Actinomycetota bacterium]MDA2950782.1 hypothetical protein [Actinomycetota bacterium]